jgi:DMSO/TMAO reductase YedYZ heme-binding membrane subunit
MATWKNIQRGAYLVFALSMVHFIFMANGLTTVQNIVEVALLLLGIATVILQVWGFLTVRARKNKMAENAS